MANEYLGLSLFIMLLSFFIILNSMSEFEDTKALPILNSLDSAFSRGTIDRKEEAPSNIPSAEASTREGSTIDKLEAFFNAQIKGLKVTKNRLGTEMTISMPVKEFEQALDNTEQALFLGPDEQDEAGYEGAPFLDTLVSLVHSGGSSKAYRMDLLLNTGQRPSNLRNEYPQILKTRSKQAASYAARLEKAGLPDNFMSVGLGGGENDVIELAFRPYVPIEIPAGTLAKAQNQNAEGINGE